MNARLNEIIEQAREKAMLQFSKDSDEAADVAKAAAKAGVAQLKNTDHNMGVYVATFVGASGIVGNGGCKSIGYVTAVESSLNVIQIDLFLKEVIPEMARGFLNKRGRLNMALRILLGVDSKIAKLF